MVTEAQVNQRDHFRADGTPKKGYEFIGDARAQSAVHFERGEVVLPYICAVCGLYHLGHVPPQFRRRRPYA